MFTLNNGVLKVDIAEPGEHPNDGVRFDRAGFITEVVLNNELHFCANENKNNQHPTSGGRGIVCEFKFNACGEAKIGERYPKLGVGLILKENDEPYKFYEKYDVTPFPVKHTLTDTKLVFETEALPCLGYAVTQKKSIEIEGNCLNIEFELTNVGEKTIETGEYCHNFLNVDGYAVGPEYEIKTPNLRDFGSEAVYCRNATEPSNLVGCGHGFTFRGYDGKIMLAEADMEGMDKSVPFKWEIHNKAAKAHIEAEDYLTPEKVVFWITDHLIAPEFIQNIKVAPGETACWARKLTFVDDSAC